MSSQDAYNDLIKSGISKSELDRFFREQKDFISKSKDIRSRNVGIGLSPITPRAYTAETLKNYVLRSGKSVKQAIKDIRESQAIQIEDYNNGTTTQIKQIVESAFSEVSEEFAKPEKIVDNVSSKINQDDLEYLQKLNAELTRYESVLENETVPQQLYDAISNIINDIRAEIYEVMLKYI